MKFKIKTHKLNKGLKNIKAKAIKPNNYELGVDPIGQYPRYHISIINNKMGYSYVDIHIDMYKHNFSVSRHHLIYNLYRKIIQT